MKGLNMLPGHALPRLAQARPRHASAASTTRRSETHERFFVSERTRAEPRRGRATTTALPALARGFSSPEGGRGLGGGWGMVRRLKFRTICRKGGEKRKCLIYSCSQSVLWKSDCGTTVPHLPAIYDRNFTQQRPQVRRA